MRENQRFIARYKQGVLSGVPIDRSKLTDFEGVFDGYEEYQPVTGHCSLCDRRFTIGASEQKNLFEVQGYPVRLILRGAGWCPACFLRRQRLAWLLRNDRYRETSELQAELETIERRERELFDASTHHFGVKKKPPFGSGVRIDHYRIIDGHQDLVGYVDYKSFEVNCGICDKRFVLSAQAQKYLLESHGVPVKMLARGAAYCADCSARRGRLNWLRKGNRYSEKQEWIEELRQLEQEEKAHRNHNAPSQEADWPYE